MKIFSKKLKKNTFAYKNTIFFSYIQDFVHRFVLSEQNGCYYFKNKKVISTIDYLRLLKNLFYLLSCSIFFLKKNYVWEYFYFFLWRFIIIFVSLWSNHNIYRKRELLIENMYVYNGHIICLLKFCGTLCFL